MVKKLKEVVKDGIRCMVVVEDTKRKYKATNKEETKRPADADLDW